MDFLVKRWRVQEAGCRSSHLTEPLAHCSLPPSGSYDGGGGGVDASDVHPLHYQHHTGCYQQQQQQHQHHQQLAQQSLVAVSSQYQPQHPHQHQQPPVHPAYFERPEAGGQTVGGVGGGVADTVQPGHQPCWLSRGYNTAAADGHCASSQSVLPSPQTSIKSNCLLSTTAAQVVSGLPFGMSSPPSHHDHHLQQHNQQQQQHGQMMDAQSFTASVPIPGRGCGKTDQWTTAEFTQLRGTPVGVVDELGTSAGGAYCGPGSLQSPPPAPPPSSSSSLSRSACSGRPVSQEPELSRNLQSIKIDDIFEGVDVGALLSVPTLHALPETDDTLSLSRMAAGGLDCGSGGCGDMYDPLAIKTEFDLDSMQAAPVCDWADPADDSGVAGVSATGCGGGDFKLSPPMADVELSPPVLQTAGYGYSCDWGDGLTWTSAAAAATASTPFSASFPGMTAAAATSAAAPVSPLVSHHDPLLCGYQPQHAPVPVPALLNARHLTGGCVEATSCNDSVPLRSFSVTPSTSQHQPQRRPRRVSSGMTLQSLLSRPALSGGSSGGAGAAGDVKMRSVSRPQHHQQQQASSAATAAGNATQRCVFSPSVASPVASVVASCAARLSSSVPADPSMAAAAQRSFTPLTPTSRLDASRGSGSSVSTGGILSPVSLDSFADDAGDSHDESDSDSEAGSAFGADDEALSAGAGVVGGAAGAGRRERYFWQYNVQAKGPKGQRLQLAQQPCDPLLVRPVIDPVFSSEFQLDGIKHSGKARRGDGNDLTPSPRKLLALRRDLLRLNQLITELTPPADLPANVRSHSRKEKNKLASRACRLKKKAQHEAFKIQLAGLSDEHKRLTSCLAEVSQVVLSRVVGIQQQQQHGLGSSGDDAATCQPKLERILRTVNKHRVAGQLSDYVQRIIERAEHQYTSGSSRNSAAAIEGAGGGGGISRNSGDFPMADENG